MRVVKWQDTSPVENPHKVDARKLYDTEHAQVIQITLKPGEKLIPHITPVDALFYVLEGEGVVEVGDEKQTVGPDILIESPARIPHCWYNNSDETLRFLVIKVPRSAESTKLL
jgi:mannose-6-phosphate isomerase-like protein (cupin superfamily)